MAERSAVFVTIPPLLSDIIAEVVCQYAGFRLVGRIDDIATLAEQLPGLAPDIVIIGSNTGEADGLGPIVLELVPAAKVLVISDDGRRAILHQMRPHRIVLCDFSPATLLAALAEANRCTPTYYGGESEGLDQC